MKIQHLSARQFISIEKDNIIDILKTTEEFCIKNSLDMPDFYSDSIVLFVKHNNKVIGFLQFYPYNKYKEFYISWLMIDKDFRGHKIFNKIFKILKSFAIKNNINAITLYCLKNNLIANTIYKKKGFIVKDSEAVSLSLNDRQLFTGYTYFIRSNN